MQPAQAFSPNATTFLTHLVGLGLADMPHPRLPYRDTATSHTFNRRRIPPHRVPNQSPFDRFPFSATLQSTVFGPSERRDRAETTHGNLASRCLDSPSASQSARRIRPRRRQIGFPLHPSTFRSASDVHDPMALVAAFRRPLPTPDFRVIHFPSAANPLNRAIQSRYSLWSQGMGTMANVFRLRHRQNHRRAWSPYTPSERGFSGLSFRDRLALVLDKTNAYSRRAMQHDNVRNQVPHGALRSKLIDVSSVVQGFYLIPSALTRS